ncbi:MAG: spermidine synthase [Alsobacter sp.]
MIPWELLDTAEMPGDGGQLRLMKRGAEFAIRLGHTELMNSRLSGSEEALASLSCHRLVNVDAACVLVGGLGMGFTLRATQKALGSGARIHVAELVPAVVEWARGPMKPLFGDCLADPRVEVHLGDVLDRIRASAKSYDAILLDVDNGPEGLTRAANDRIYDAAGLAHCFGALQPGGILSVWSAAPDSSFQPRLERAGFSVDVATVKADRRKRGARHVIWLAKRP